MTTTKGISRSVRICRWQARVNSLWLWVYCLLTLALQAYLLYRAVVRCKQYNELPWRTLDKPVVELYVYIALIVLSVMCVPFFIITCIFKVGNYPGDGVRLGRENIHEDELAEAAATESLSGSTSNVGNGTIVGDSIQEEGKVKVVPKRTVLHRFRALWRHIGPFCHGFHVLAAFSLLLPSMLLEAQEIRFGFRSPDVAWQSDLDVLFGRWQYPGERDARYAVEYAPVDSTSPSDNLSGGTTSRNTLSMTPEYMNYIGALLLYSIRYSAVFWYTKMSFSIAFAVQMIIITVHYGMSFCGISVLYKFQVNHKGFPDLNLALPASASLLLFIIADALLLFSSIAIFNYGFQHYKRRWYKFLQAYAPAYAKKCNSRQNRHGYGPHIMATVALLFVICCRGAIVYDYVIVYRKTGFPMILGCIIMDAIYMVSWITIWFVLTLKHDWDFQIMFARYVLPSSSRQSSRCNNHTNSHRNDISTENVSVNPSSESNGQTAESAPAVAADNHNITLTVDIVDCPNTQGPISPTGVLRKSNNRRSAQNQRVKFDETAANKDDPTKTKDKENSKSDSKKRKLSKGEGASHKNKESREGEATETDGQNGNFRRAYNHSFPQRRRRKESSDEECITESTPESTLTRGYRHSIRDMCGQYFRISRDMIPPAAQSSPLPNDKTIDFPELLRTDGGEIIMNPLEADKLYPTNYTYQNVRSESDKALVHVQGPDGVQHQSRVPLRRQLVYNKDHEMARQQPDVRYSYPLAALGEHWVNDEYYLAQYSPSHHQHSRHSRNHPGRHSMQVENPIYSTPRGHNGSYLKNIDKQKSRPRDQIYGSHDTSLPQYENHNGSKKSKVDDTRPPTPPRPPKNQDSLVQPRRSREHSSNKPDLSHRDSALPSSNETSSNDSNDVLCSQV